MSHLRWHGERLELHRPVLLAAVEGWNDAGESATTAVRFLARALGARATTAATGVMARRRMVTAGELAKVGGRCETGSRCHAPPTSS